MDYGDFRRYYQDVSLTTVVGAADDLSSTARSLIAAKTGWQIFVQRILVAVTTDNAATLTFRDTAGTPVPVAATDASPGEGPIAWDFGAKGFALTADKGLELANSAAGLAASITVEAYRRRTPNTSISQAASKA